MFDTVIWLGALCLSIFFGAVVIPAIVDRLLDRLLRGVRPQVWEGVVASTRPRA